MKERKLVLATHNAGKRAELETLLAPLNVHIQAAELPEPEETGQTFAENAALKALAAAQATHLPALADDSGLTVAGLKGAPGIYSARWAQDKNYTEAFARIEKELREFGHEPTGAAAAFVCCLCLAQPNGAVFFFEGRVEGTLRFPPHGAGGFGYDPIFVPQGESVTFAEMPADAKHAISHRGRALIALRVFLDQQGHTIW